MAQQASDARFRYGSENFPIHFDDGCLRVFTNPSNEVFVEDIKTGVKIRISSYYYAGGGLEFTTSGRVEPTRVTNMIGWRIGPR